MLHIVLAITDKDNLTETLHAWNAVEVPADTQMIFVVERSDEGIQLLTRHSNRTIVVEDFADAEDHLVEWFAALPPSETIWATTEATPTPDFLDRIRNSEQFASPSGDRRALDGCLWAAK